MKKIKGIIIVLTYIFLITNNCVYGSFADYTDEQAAKDTEKMIEEHNNYDYTKSNNNYLKDLNVKEGVLSPEFDKQTINYRLTLTNSVEEISISAIAEDEKANIKGNGTVSIKDEEQCIIEVTAESGTVRTYFINIIRPGESIQANVSNTIQEIDNSITEDDLNKTKNENNNEVQNKSIYLIATIGAIAVITIIFLIILRN